MSQPGIVSRLVGTTETSGRSGLSDGERSAFAIVDPMICQGRHFADRFAFSACMAYSSKAVSWRPRIGFPFTCVVGHELAGECIDLDYFTTYSFAFY
jgi:hypothetical protein